MARVLFSLTDAQLLCLEKLRGGATQLWPDVDQRTLTGLVRRSLIAQEGDARRHSLTPQGIAVLALCERLAISAAKPKGGKP